MTLTKYQSPPELEARFNRDLGRSMKDANVRFPVQNPVYEAVLRAQGRAQPNRANILIQSRSGHQAPQQSRSWMPFVPAIGAGGWPEGAWAIPADAISFEALSVLETIDWSNPGYALGLGGAIFGSQILAMIQRQVIINRLKPVAQKADQPELFPDSVIQTDPAHSPWDIDAATRQGKIRSENQDAIATLSFCDGTRVLAVCDGAGGVEGGKEASHSAVEAIQEHLKAIYEENSHLVPMDLEGGIDAARLSAAEKSLNGLTTVLLVLLHNDHVHWATLGDGDIVIIWPDGMVNHVQVPHHTAGMPSNIINAYIGKNCHVPPRTGSLRVEPGGMVLVMSDGASDLFPYEDVALNRDDIKDITGLADSFLQNLEDARDPETAAYLHNDNMSLAMACLTTGGDHAE